MRASTAASDCPGRKPPFLAIEQPARPYKTTTERRFTTENAKDAKTPRAGPDRERRLEDRDPAAGPPYSERDAELRHLLAGADEVLLGPPSLRYTLRAWRASRGTCSQARTRSSGETIPPPPPRACRPRADHPVTLHGHFILNCYFRSLYGFSI
jgi:hypothetical protein